MIKKISAILLATIISMGIIGEPASVYANNYHDQTFTFAFKNTMLYTTAREKMDTSKLYMKCTKMSKSGVSYTAHAVGTNSLDVIGKDCSRGNTYYFAAGTSKYLTSWVKEDGYSHARIAASPNYSYGFTATTKWSPDNYNGY